MPGPPECALTARHARAEMPGPLVRDPTARCVRVETTDPLVRDPTARYVRVETPGPPARDPTARCVQAETPGPPVRALPDPVARGNGHRSAAMARPRVPEPSFRAKHDRRHVAKQESAGQGRGVPTEHQVAMSIPVAQRLIERASHGSAAHGARMIRSPDRVRPDVMPTNGGLARGGGTSDRAAIGVCEGRTHGREATGARKGRGRRLLRDCRAEPSPASVGKSVPRRVRFRAQRLVRVGARRRRTGLAR